MIVYTAIFNHYDRPLEPLHPSACAHVLFTDAPMNAPGWDVRVLPRRFDNPARENRYYKLQPHRLFPDADRVIYHDGGMRLIPEPARLLERLQRHAGRDHSVFTLRHSLRHNMRDEFGWVRRQRITDPELLLEQEHAYASGPWDAPVAEARLLVSRPDAAAFYDAWWAEVARWTHRDQLSFAVAQQATGADVHLVDGVDWREMFTKRPHRRPQLTGAA